MQNTSSKSKHLIFGSFVIAGIFVFCIIFFIALKQKTTSPTSQSENFQTRDVARKDETSENKSPETNNTKKPSVIKPERVEDYPESVRPLVEKIFALRGQKAQAEKAVADLEDKKIRLMVIYTEEYHRVKDLSVKLSKAKEHVAEIEGKLRPLESELIDRMQLEKPQGRSLV